MVEQLEAQIQAATARGKQLYRDGRKDEAMQVMVAMKALKAQLADEQARVEHARAQRQARKEERAALRLAAQKVGA